MGSPVEVVVEEKEKEEKQEGRKTRGKGRYTLDVMIVSNTKGGVWKAARQLRAPARIQLILRLVGQLRACRCAAVKPQSRLGWRPHSQWWLLGGQRETQVPEQRPLDPLAPLPISPVDWRRPSQPSILTLECFLGRLMKSVPLTTTRPGPISQSPAIGQHNRKATGPSSSRGQHSRSLPLGTRLFLLKYIAEAFCLLAKMLMFPFGHTFLTLVPVKAGQEGLTTRGDGSEMNTVLRMLLLFVVIILRTIT